MPNKTFMKLARRTLIVCAVLLLAVSAFGYFFWYKPKFHSPVKSHAFAFRETRYKKDHETFQRLKHKATPAKDFVKEHGYNSTHCFLIDMRLPSGKNRFFVYNLLK